MIILSAERSNLTVKENRVRTLSLMKKLRMFGYTFKVIRGNYRTIGETSIVVQSNNIGGLVYLSAMYNQDCILHVDDVNSRAMFCSALSSDIVGTWSKVSKDIALDSVGYSKIGLNYFTII